MALAPPCRPGAQAQGPGRRLLRSRGGAVYLIPGRQPGKTSEGRAPGPGHRRDDHGFKLTKMVPAKSTKHVVKALKILKASPKCLVRFVGTILVSFKSSQDLESLTKCLVHFVGTILATLGKAEQQQTVQSKPKQI